METKHTPGPWAARKPDDIGGSRVYADCKGGSLIATPGYMRDESESEANARLIAAAPELLEALMGRHPFEICEIENCDACAIIAKATGQ